MRTLSEIKRLALKKWAMHIGAGGYSHQVVNDEELKGFLYQCSFCNEFPGPCDKCPLLVNDDCCEGLVNTWFHNKSIETAQAIYNFIDKTVVIKEEFEPCGKAFTQPKNPEIPRKLTDSEFENYVIEVHKYYNEHHLRLGQSYYNVLAILHPQLAESLNGTDADPFYIESNFPRFFKRIH